MGASININLDGPDQNLTYAVGVNYFTDRGYGQSTATIRLFIQGHLHTEIESAPMVAGQFWDVLRVHGALDDLAIIDEVFDEMP
jgi:hypothetical protein